MDKTSFWKTKAGALTIGFYTRNGKLYNYISWD